MRHDYLKSRPEIAARLFGISGDLARGPLEESLRELVSVRISQINGCSFCIDTHMNKALAAGVEQLKLNLLTQWSDVDMFDFRERAALGLAEKLTRIEGRRISDDDYQEMLEDFGEDELTDLVHLIALMNSWNRMSVFFGYRPGD
jgi:AhpD family alkylhydroperoxidase